MGIFMVFDEINRLEELKKEFKTAEDLNVKHCVKCGYCCHWRTCIPTPEELKQIAEFLKLTVIDTIKKYFCIDQQNCSNVYYVKPAGTNQLDLLGKYIPTDRTWDEGKCIFLDDNNLCKIYPVRPETARNKKCWKPKNKSNRKNLLKKWEKISIKETYPELNFWD